MSKKLGFIAGIFLLLAFLFSTGVFGGTVTATTSVTEFNEVKSFFITYTEYSIQPGAAPMIDCAASWTAPVDLMIIGAEAGSFITLHYNPSYGMIYCTGELSLDTHRNTPGRITQVEARIECRNYDPGGSFPDFPPQYFMWGDNIKQKNIMFPANCGMFVDAGEKVYLHWFSKNEMNHEHLGSVGMTVFYIER